MQTSHKILITTAGVLLALFVSSLMVLRGDVQTIIESKALTNPLTNVPVEQFKAIHFSGNWKVQIKQGRSYKVELAFDKEGNYLPQLENRNDTLYFSIQGDSLAQVEARVFTPYLNGIKAINGANIRLRNFDVDTMNFVLDHSHLIGEENKLIYTSYVTTGNSKIEFIDDPFK